MLSHIKKSIICKQMLTLQAQMVHAERLHAAPPPPPAPHLESGGLPEAQCAAGGAEGWLVCWPWACGTGIMLGQVGCMWADCWSQP